MTQDEDKIQRRIALFICISLLLHLGLASFFYFMQTPRQSEGAPVQPPQEVVFIRPEDMIPPPPVVSASQLELADIAKPKVEKIPQKARFKSQYNSSVKDETVAPRVPKKARIDAETAEEDGQKGDDAERTGPKREAKRKDVAMVNPKEAALEPKPPEEKPPEELPAEKSISLKDLELHPSDFKDLMKEPKKKKEDQKETKVAMKKDQETRDFNLMPSMGKTGQPGDVDHFAHDFLPGVKIGDKTYLDALAFPDVQYFTRLKRAFRMRFNPVPPLRAHLSGNRLVVGKVNVTMAVSVSSSGQITELFVVKSSGIPGYDDEALRTIRQSSPFSAPPQKIMDKDGMLRMTWNFITYL